MKITRHTITRFRALALTLPLVGNIITLGSVPIAAHAQEATSAIAGVSVPKGATRISDAGLQAGVGRVIADAAKLFGLPARAGGVGTTEIYCWEGDSYKEGRALFMQTSLKSTLTHAGYTYEGIDAHVRNIPNFFDTDAYDDRALDMSPWDSQPAFFYGTSVKNRKTVVGVWLDQKSSKRVLLIVGEAGFAGAPTETKVPEVTDPNVWIIKDLSNASRGMPTAALPAFPPLAAKPRTVRGMVKDSKGKPITGAHIVAQVTAAGGFYTLHEAATNAQGIYEIVLPVGIARIDYADCRVTCNGQVLVLPLHPVDGVRDQFDARRGHVENFVLRSSGTASESGGNYGGSIRLNTQNAPLGSMVEVTLTPTGLLMDGSKAKTLVFRYPVKTTLPETIVSGVPIGNYTLSAKLYDGDDVLPLQARNTFADKIGEELPLAESLPIVFKSVYSERPLLGQSGVRRVEVTLAP